MSSRTILSVLHDAPKHAQSIVEGERNATLRLRDDGSNGSLGSSVVGPGCSTRALDPVGNFNTTARTVLTILSKWHNAPGNIANSVLLPWRLSYIPAPLRKFQAPRCVKCQSSQTFNENIPML